jgi:cysteine desulfurase/selenocysteine lyase
MTTSPSISDPAGQGLPDIAALTRLANDFFRTPAPAAAAPAVPAPAAATSAAAVPAQGATVGGPTAAAAHQHQDGRAPSAVAGSPTAPIIPPGIPGEAELRELLNPRGAALPSIPGQPTAVPASAGHVLAAPAAPPAALPTAENASYYFLQYQTPRSHPVAAVQDPWSTAIPGIGAGPAPIDLHRVRRDFPILEERVNGRRLVWLDNAATTQKPRQVIERLSYFYEHENSNIHRAAHALAARATDAYESARDKVRTFLNASSSEEIVFVRGATEAINLVAHSWGRATLKPGDEILLSHLEHHANIVPWQQVAAATGAVIKVIPVDDDGQVRLDAYGALLSAKTRIVSFTQVSNALGTVTPAQHMTSMARAAGARVLIDGAQAVSHMPVDVRALGCDWYVFSGHKVFGPTGIGVLYGTKEILNLMPPWQGGGNMIADVTFQQTRYQPPPYKFEAGTGNIADAVGLGAAIDYVTALGMPAIAAYEHQLLVYGTRLLHGVPGLRLIGTAAEKAGVLSFVLSGYETAEVGKALDQDGIAVRSGHHCAQPILRRFGLESTVRPSLAFYNTCADLDALAASLHRLADRKRLRR